MGKAGHGGKTGGRDGRGAGEVPRHAPLGCHVSIAGGLSEALRRGRRLGCTAIQIFSHNPRAWAMKPLPREDVLEFRELARDLNMHVFIHASYLINIAAENPDLRTRSVRFLEEELNRADHLEIPYVVLHPGTGSGLPEAEARELATRSLSELGRRPNGKARLLLENTAGARGDATYRMEDLGSLAVEAGDAVSGVCLDTCHAFAAGYNLRSIDGRRALIDGLEGTVGLDRVRLIHVNDSRRECGSRRDRHEHIGRGQIGSRALRSFLTIPEIRGTPVILETPKETDGDDTENLGAVRRMLG